MIFLLLLWRKFMFLNFLLLFSDNFQIDFVIFLSYFGIPDADIEQWKVLHPNTDWDIWG